MPHDSATPTLEPHRPPSAPRIDAIDLARGTAVLFMPLVHSLYMYGDRAILREPSLFRSVMHAIGHEAPMFLLAMGLSFVFSRNQSPARSARRGLRLLWIGYATSAAEFIPPILVGTMPESFVEANDMKSPLRLEQYLHLIGDADILHMAGLSLLFMGLARHAIKSRYVMFGLALLIALLSGVVQGYRPGIPILDALCDLLWGREWNVYFPVVPWASSVFMGMAFGMYIQDCGGDAAPAFRWMARLGSLLAVVGGLLWWHDPALHYRDFFHMGPGGTLYLMGVTAIGFWLIHKSARFLKATWFGRFAMYCSPRVTSLYVTHWILISWGMGIVGFREHAAPTVVALSLVVLVATIAVEAAYRSSVTALRSLLTGVTEPQPRPY
jgi:uncharacterized membrane protein